MIDNVVGNFIGSLSHNIGLPPEQTKGVVGEVVRLLSAKAGGIQAMLGRATSLGIISHASEWLGQINPPAINAEQTRAVIGSDAVDEIASNLHMRSDHAASVLGQIIPKLIGHLTPEGVLPTTLPADMLALIPGAAASTATAEASTANWALRGLAFAAVLGALWWLTGQMGNSHQSAEAPKSEAAKTEAATAPAQQAPTPPPAPAHSAAPNVAPKPAPAATPAPTPAPTAPAATTSAAAPAAPPAATVPALQPKLSVSENNGTVTYSGTVRDDATRAGIIAAMAAAFGADKVKGDLSVDANAAPAPWLASLEKLLALFKSSGSGSGFAFNLSGPDVKVGALPQGSDRSGLMAALAGLVGGGSIALPSLAASLPHIDAKTAMGAIQSLKPEQFKADALLTTLSQLSIGFATNSAEVPADSREVLVTAASLLKKLPANTRVEVQGYTDDQGTDAINVPLSRDRANAVRDVLVQAGVAQEMLVAKGFGSADPIAGNDTAEGRARNRRIDFSVVGQ